MDTTSLNEEIGYKVTRYIMNGGRIKIKDALQNVAEEVENFSRMPFFV